LFAGEIVNQENRAIGELPTDPETNTRYRHLNQLNPELWRQAADLVEKPKEDMNLETITNKGNEDEHESKRI
jgi:hypothetical protein